MNGGWQETEGYRSAGLTPAVRNLLILTGIAYLLQVLVDALSGKMFTAVFGLSIPYFIRRHFYWQIVTYMFLHGGPGHILFNLLALVFIGPETERALGARHFYILYLLSGVLAGIGWVMISPAPWALCVGASGAIFGVLAAFATLFPHRLMTLLFFPFVYLKAWVLVLILSVLQLIFIISPDRDGIAYAAHLVGAIAGYCYVIFLRPGSFVFRMPRWRPKARSPDAPSREEIDRILDKITQQGIHSLTPQERSKLEKASRESRGL